MAKKGTVKVVKDPDTRVVICDERKKAWKDDYSYYYATKRRWPLAVRLSSDVDFIVESIVYLSAFYFIIQGTLREYSAGIIILTFLIDFIVINVVLKHLGQRKLFLTSFTEMEITNNLSEKALYDYKIVRNAIAGDEKAYGELFKRYKDSVYFMILKMVNNRTDAEDLMFEAFEKAFASLNYYSPRSILSGKERRRLCLWMSTISILKTEGISIVFRLMSERRMKKRFVSNVPILCGKRSLF